MARPNALVLALLVVPLLAPFAGRVTPRLVVVPDVVGDDMLLAKAKLLDRGFAVGVVREVPGDARPRWSVVKQSPVAGLAVDATAVIDLEVASGHAAER